MITTESLWLKKIRRNKFKSFVYIFLPSLFIFLLAFSLAPAKGASNTNNLLYSMGGILQPRMMFTAGVVPKRFHSRRDSFNVRYTPLLAALGYGATSIEIYLWLTKNGSLCVGARDPDDGNQYEQTLDGVYLSKLQQMVEDVNQDWPNKGMTRGVFQTAPYLPLQLVMNIKCPSGPPGPNRVSQTIDALDAALQPLLQARYLTTADTKTPGAPLRLSALTIVITGVDSVPESVLNPQGPIRYMFYDAPLKELDGNPMYTPDISPMASASFSSLVGSRWVVPRLARKKIKHHVQIAHSKGIAVRVTEPIDFPGWIRNMYWQILLDCGVDWLDVDDLYSASQF